MSDKPLHRHYLHYSELPFSQRVLYTAAFMVLGIGYLFAMLNIYFTYAGRAGGNPYLLSVDDLIVAYSGSGKGSRLEAALRGPMSAMLPAGTYRAWVVETDAGAIVAGGGVSVLPWPPGPHFMGTRIGVVYNVYTEHVHRRRGLARQLMETLHGWCARQGIGAIALNASDDAQRLYESLGYQVAASPMLWKIT